MVQLRSRTKSTRNSETSVHPDSSHGLRAEYFRATGEMDARIRARQEAEQKAFKDAQAAAKARKPAPNRVHNDPGTIEARRCIESGRTRLSVRSGDGKRA